MNIIAYHSNQNCLDNILKKIVGYGDGTTMVS